MSLSALFMRAAGIPSSIHWADQDTVRCVALSTYKCNKTRIAAIWFEGRDHLYFMPASSADNLVRQTHIQPPAAFPGARNTRKPGRELPVSQGPTLAPQRWAHIFSAPK